MRNQYCKRTSVTGIRLIVLAVLLRSLIAPGFMLSVTADSGLNIIFCDGPVSLQTGQVDHSAHHHGDGDATQGEVHISPICSQWSTSSLLVFSVIFEPALFDAIQHQTVFNYDTPLFQQYIDSTRTTRGPPALV